MIPLCLWTDAFKAFPPAYLDKLIDELAKGKPMDKILRGQGETAMWVSGKRLHRLRAGVQPHVPLGRRELNQIPPLPIGRHTPGNLFHRLRNIPELAKGNPEALGVYVIGSEGKHSWAGDCRQKFTIQSVVKPILLLQALRMSVHITIAPILTMGLICPLSRALSPALMASKGLPVASTPTRFCTRSGPLSSKAWSRRLGLTRQLAGDNEIGVDEAVYQSEKSHGSKNRALAYLLKSNGLLEDSVEEVLDCYFRACSITPTRFCTRSGPLSSKAWSRRIGFTTL